MFYFKFTVMAAEQ